MDLFLSPVPCLLFKRVVCIVLFCVLQASAHSAGEHSLRRTLVFLQEVDRRLCLCKHVSAKGHGQWTHTYLDLDLDPARQLTIAN